MTGAGARPLGAAGAGSAPVVLDPAVGRLDPPDEFDLVVFRPEGAGVPLLLVRTWTDELEKHRRLARSLGVDQPVFSVGIRTDREDLPRSAGAWATACFERVSPWLPPGPVTVGGWSFGGVVALALADLLDPATNPVRGVLMLDASLPRAHERQKAGGVHETLRRVVRILDLFPPGPQRRARVRQAAANAPHTWWRWGKRRGRYVIARLRARRASVEPPPAYDRTAMTPLKRAIWTAYLTYRPAPTSHRLTILWTGTSHIASGNDASLGWARVLTAPMDLIPVGGTHYTMFDDEHIESLAAEVRAGLTGRLPRGGPTVGG